MRRIYLTALSLFILISIHTTSKSQNYDWGVGLRLGVPGSVSFKKNFPSNGHGAEIAIGTPVSALRWNFGRAQVVNPRGVTLFTAYHIQKQLGGYGGLVVYFGPTLVISAWKKCTSGGCATVPVEPYIDIGGNLGVEYTFDFPITVFVDFVPVIELIQDSGTVWSYSGFGIRYVIF